MRYCLEHFLSIAIFASQQLMNHAQSLIVHNLIEMKVHIRVLLHLLACRTKSFLLQKVAATRKQIPIDV